MHSDNESARAIDVDAVPRMFVGVVECGTWVGSVFSTTTCGELLQSWNVVPPYSQRMSESLQ
jgi:hypothetical protein